MVKLNIRYAFIPKKKRTTADIAYDEIEAMYKAAIWLVELRYRQAYLELVAKNKRGYIVDNPCKFKFKDGKS